MKHRDKLLACVLGVMFSGGKSQGETSVPPANPYAAIARQNVFRLSPPPKFEIKVTPPEPPPTIKLQGITNILGRRQVFLKVSIPARHGEPARENCYILNEGQHEGEIEVLAIDEQAGTVKFNNHGTVQTLSL